MITTAQEALTAFEDSWVSLQWTQMTDAQRNTYLRQYLGLQIAARKEIEANRIESETEQVTLAAQRTLAAIAYLQNLGFVGDNSQADWYKLYNRPHIFGANWQAQADYQISISTGVDYFICKVYELGKEFVND